MKIILCRVSQANVAPLLHQYLKQPPFLPIFDIYVIYIRTICNSFSNELQYSTILFIVQCLQRPIRSPHPSFVEMEERIFIKKKERNLSSYQLFSPETKVYFLLKYDHFKTESQVPVTHNLHIVSSTLF